MNYDKKIKELEKENDKLRDENESLWMLLEELEESRVDNPKYKEHFEAAFKKVRCESLMTSKVEVEA